ncbi:MAG: hypothetical protein V1815_02795 [Candidatus Woesearchaeota archaeon]
MKQLSDNTIIILVCIAIVLTLIVSFVDFNKINNLITGASSATEIGYVNVTIQANILINSTDPNINFGNCKPITGGTQHWSNDTTTGGTGSGQCSSLTAIDNITIQNLGNTDANVSVKTGHLAPSLIGGTAPKFQYTTENATGCKKHASSGLASLDSIIVNFTAINTPYRFCDNLSFAVSARNVEMWAGIFIPADAPADTIAAYANLTFVGVAT